MFLEGVGAVIGGGGSVAGVDGRGAVADVLGRGPVAGSAVTAL
ncbi:hypothetical protein [Streptomyces malaysiensis]